SYAEAVTQGAPKETPRPKHKATAYKTLKAQDLKEKDNRLFIRLPPDHPARNHQPFAIKAAIITQLDLVKDTIREVQHVKSGITIVPSGKAA
ncbi:uncharacterized protein K452DRAFT_210264, partial [Aplosporella prunicola CBS 121167]